MDAVKWLLLNVDAQERSDRKYWAVGDPIFLKQFNEEADEYRRTIADLKAHDVLGRVPSSARSMKRKFSRTHTMHYFTDM